MGTEQASGRGPWVDQRLQRLAPKPWRKVHLDFHNTPFVGSVGDGFKPEEFAELLELGRVNGIVIFAKDMHGYFYFPHEDGPVHPGLTRDLFGEQLAACRNAGVVAYGYYCVTYDNVRAEEHPEWLVVRRDRTTYLPRFDEVPAWTALCLANQEFVSTVLSDSREILARYELDGIWYDMSLPIDRECFCRTCLAEIRAAGGDPFDIPTQRAHKQELLVGFLRKARAVVDEVRPGCQIDHNNQTRLGLGDRVAYVDNVDIEALPTGGWGYHYFPVNVRYSRTFGRSFYGLTGRFQESWADFGGLKHPRQLAVELASIVAQGAHCSVGDQAPPSGRLDRAVYEAVGQAYAGIERIEALLEAAAPVVEAAIVVDGEPLLDIGETHFGPGSTATLDPMVEGVVGLTELLVDQRVQFDIVEPRVDLDRYRLVVVPDGTKVGPALAAQLQGFVANGGALLAFGGSAAIGGDNALWLPGFDVQVVGRSPFVPAYLLPGGALLATLANFEYALYTGTFEWRVQGGDAEVWARVGVPAFQRGPEHYTSHVQSPFSRATDMAAVVRSGKVGATSFEMGAAYPTYRLLGLPGDIRGPARRSTTPAPCPSERATKCGDFAHAATAQWQGAVARPHRERLRRTTLGPSAGAFRGLCPAPGYAGDPRPARRGPTCMAGRERRRASGAPPRRGDRRPGWWASG